MSIYRNILSLRYKAYHFFNLKNKKILYASPIHTKKELSYFVNTIASLIPYRKGLEIRVVVMNDLLNVKFKDLKINKFQGDFIKNRDLRHIKTIRNKIVELFRSDFIIVDNKDYLKKISLFFYKTEIINMLDGSSVGPEYYKRVNWLLNDKKKNRENLRKSEEAFSRLLKSKEKSKKSVVIGGGPSLNRYNEINFNEYDFNISVNDFVISNNDFFSKSLLDAVCFLDSTLFFGSSKFTREFFDKLQRAFNYRKFYIFIDIKSYDIVDLNGEFENYIIGVNTEPLSGFKLISPNDLIVSTRPSSNVLTSFAMIIGMSISDEIILLGADGIKKNQDKIMNNKNSNTDRSTAYENINADLPDFYRSYKSAIKSHDEYNFLIKECVDFGRLNNKKVTTFYRSNYKSLSNATINRKTKYFNND